MCMLIPVGQTVRECEAPKHENHETSPHWHADECILLTDEELDKLKSEHVRKEETK